MATAKPKTETPRDPYELVRVRDTAVGQSRTVKRLVAESDKDRYKIIANARTVDANGRPLPAKPVQNIQTPDTPSDGATPSVATETTKEN